MPGSARIPREAMIGDPFLGFLKPALGFLGKVVGKGVKAYLGIPSGPKPPQQAMPPSSALVGPGQVGPGMGHRARKPMATGTLGPNSAMVLPPIPSAPTGANAQITIPGRSAASLGMRMNQYGQYVRRYRHMNPLNIRALRRAIRRTHGFEKIARKLLAHPVSKRFKHHRRKR